MIQIFSYVGALRAMLYILVLMLTVSALFSFGETHKSGLMMFPTLIAPVLVPMFFFVIPLDMTMCKIMMSDKSEQSRKRYKNMIWLDLAALAILFVAWLPFYKDLLLL